MLSRLMAGPSYRLLEAASLLAAGLLTGPLGGWPLLAGLLPWLVRLAVTRPRLRPGWGTGLVAAFLLSAVAGAWAAYNPAAAEAKFWMLLGAGLLYLVVASQPAEALWPLAGLWQAVAALVGLDFLLAYDWTAASSDLGLITRLGRAWQAVRPAWPHVFLDANLAGGVLAALLPYGLAWLGRAAGRRRWLALAGAAALTALGAASFFLASSRGAWLALAGGLVLSTVWVGAGAMARRRAWLAGRVEAGLSMVVLAGAGLLISVFPGGLVGLANRLPGLASGTSRWDLAVNTFHLALDFPFTGGGLRAFTGLYSTYALLIQVPLFTYAHNFYMDVLLEQGLMGLAALLGLLALSGWRLTRRGPAALDDGALLRWAALASLLAVAGHGLIDDALYGNAGTPLVFLWAAVAAVFGRPMAGAEAPAVRRPSRRWRVGAGLAGLAVVIALALSWSTVAASYAANLGAVALARAQLTGWPEAPDPAPDLSPARRWLNLAVQWDPAQPVARHRLGLLALGARDFPAAVSHLELAYAGEPGYRGVRKALGYAYAWLGAPESAAALLRDLPEVREELGVYAWWWGTQGRPDLAERAASLQARLTLVP